MLSYLKILVKSVRPLYFECLHPLHGSACDAAFNFAQSLLQESAVLREDAAAVMREIIKMANVYILAHVIDDLGEATVRGALEAGGLVGPSAGHVPPHRVLFCSTLEGKVSIVRQLEPALHIDGHPQTVRTEIHSSDMSLKELSLEKSQGCWMFPGRL